MRGRVRIAIICDSTTRQHNEQAMNERNLYRQVVSKCGILVKIIKIMIKIIKTFLLIGHNERAKNQKNLYRQDVSKCGILAKVCVDPVRERKLLFHPYLSTTMMVIIKICFMETMMVI